MPFNGPIGAARVGYINGEYVLNPGQTQLQGFADGSGRCRHRSRRADGGIRSPATAEEVMLGAVVFGHEQGKIAIDAIHELVREGGKPAWDWTAPPRTKR
jgi:polyribonucleotide nucleotidyltransferase